MSQLSAKSIETKQLEEKEASAKMKPPTEVGRRFGYGHVQRYEHQLLCMRDTLWVVHLMLCLGERTNVSATLYLCARHYARLARHGVFHD